MRITSESDKICAVITLPAKKNKSLRIRGLLLSRRARNWSFSIQRRDEGFGKEASQRLMVQTQTLKQPALTRHCLLMTPSCFHKHWTKKLSSQRPHFNQLLSQRSHFKQILNRRPKFKHMMLEWPQFKQSPSQRPQIKHVLILSL